jgi:hypothetical protein
MDQRVQCLVLDAAVPVQEATAFRLVEEVGESFFLDFLVRCPQTLHYELVLRLRLQRDVLMAVIDRLIRDVMEVPLGMVN